VDVSWKLAHFYRKMSGQFWQEICNWRF